jgi:predicted ATPase/DNA-binding CsgD family transcriptional regulator
MNRRSARLGNLPLHLTSFVGRRRDLAELAAAVRTTRLVSLLGPAGIGKTRLALQLAGELSGEFADGAWLVELQGLGAGQPVADVIAGVTGAAGARGDDRIDVLCTALQARTMLIVIDSCELVTDDVAAVLGPLLATCPGLSVVATSRVPIRLAGEQAWHVSSLDLPPLDSDLTAEELGRVDSVALYLQRARLQNPRIAIEPYNREDIVRLLRYCDGLPLVIELIAKWAATLTSGELLRHLMDLDVRDRLGHLTTSDRTADPRHSSLLAAIESSHAALDADSRVMFHQLGVFAGGWNTASMSAVCAPTAHSPQYELRRLVDHSFVTARAAPGGGLRYRLLEPLRDYALFQLRESSEAAATRERFVRYFAGLVREASPILATRDGPQALDTLDTEIDNLRAVLGLEGVDPEVRLEVAVALVPYWHFRGLLLEGRRRLQSALAGAVPTTPLAVAALIGLSRLAWAQGDLPWAGRHGRQAFRRARQIGDRQGAAAALLRIAQVRFESGHMTSPRRWAEHAVREGVELADDRLVAAGLLKLGEIALVDERADEADALLTRAIDLFARTNQVDQEAIALLGRGRLLLQQGSPDRAEAALIRSLSSLREFRLPRHSIPLVESLAAVAAEHADLDRAARLAGAGKGLGERIGARPPVTAPMRLAVMERLGPLLASSEARLAFEAGRAMTLDEVIAYALGEPVVNGAVERQPEPQAPAEEKPARGGTLLTERQLQVARALARGLTNKEIAAELHISVRTVEDHVFNVCDRLNLENRVMVGVWAAKQTPG